MEVIKILLNYLKNILWLITTILIIFIGVYFTWKLKGKQFKFGKIIRQLIKNENNHLGINSFSSLMLSLAGRIGVGSISGVALAIYLAGPGTIFWIWIISFISAIIGYVESYLGIKYRKIDVNNTYVGGPAYYIKNGLNNQKLGTIYAIMIIACYCGGFMLIQANTISKAVITLYSNVSPLFIGIILCYLTWIIIFKGIETLTKTTNKLVPIMSLGYVSLAIFVILTNIEILPIIFKLIINDAFTYKSFTGGFLTTMLLGIQKGIFSNEGGIGTGSMACAISGSDDCEGQGLIQVIGIYITTFLICTSSATMILISNYNNFKISDPNGIELAMMSFYEHFGYIGNIFLLIAIFLFAFSTILSGYFYGETNLKFIINNCSKKNLNILKFCVGLVIFLGTIMSSNILWKVTDIMIAIIAIINLYALWKLRTKIKE